MRIVYDAIGTLADAVGWELNQVDYLAWNNVSFIFLIRFNYFNAKSSFLSCSIKVDHVVFYCSLGI